MEAAAEERRGSIDLANGNHVQDTSYDARPAVPPTDSSAAMSTSTADDEPEGAAAVLLDAWDYSLYENVKRPQFGASSKKIKVNCNCYATPVVRLMGQSPQVCLSNLVSLRATTGKRNQSGPALGAEGSRDIRLLRKSTTAIKSRPRRASGACVHIDAAGFRQGWLKSAWLSAG